MTVSGAFDYINPVDDVDTMSKQYARGLLMNARGNSGAILSQIFRGFAQALVGKTDIDDSATAITAFVMAKEVGYKSVLAPVEGTILTVIRMTAEDLEKNQKEYRTPEQVFSAAVTFAKQALDKTPSLLPMLKKAGVVDSANKDVLLIGASPESNKGVSAENDVANADYGYCCEVIVRQTKAQAKAFNEAKLKKSLSELADSLVTVQDEDIVKVHAHSPHPGKFLEIAHALGDFHKVKIDNMSVQAQEHSMRLTGQQENGQHKKAVNAKPKNGSNHEVEKHASDKNGSLAKLSKKNEEPRVKQAVIVTVPSKAIGEMLKREYGVDAYIDQERAGNPSTGDFDQAIRQAHAETVFLVTDSSNNQLSAGNAIKLQENCVVNLIGARTIIEAIAAALSFNAQTHPRYNYRRMRNAIRLVETGLVSTSIRSIRYDDLIVRKDDFIGVVNKKVSVASKNLDITLAKTIRLMLKRKPNTKLIQVICGKQAPKASTNELKKIIATE
ncbi:unnamed protein product [Didymodactylos carnosus]|uniref:DhaL domain-containing protein n=1 Tax=Didymodactylos carnosus TaxID=1234261 RepID=A0A8S2GJS2_9BILA|nr:unnamed protein product [Didymodactylos carnosus]CAF3524000.1 unnamed protein product [Didymodactylos carnosus]